MRLLLIRHAIAEDLDQASEKDDAARPLTPDGKKKMKAAANGLRKVVPKIDLLATSPLTRAVQTAHIVYAAYGDKPQFVELEMLGVETPPQKVLAWLKGQDLDSATVALVGHGPWLNEWAGWFVTGRARSIVTLKKGAVCVIDFPGSLAMGKGVVHALLQPGHLRRLG